MQVAEARQCCAVVWVTNPSEGRGRAAHPELHQKRSLGREKCELDGITGQYQNSNDCQTISRCRTFKGDSKGFSWSIHLFPHKSHNACSVYRWGSEGTHR